MRYVCLSILCLFIYSCGYSLVSTNPSKLDAVLIYESTPLNKLLVKNIKSNQGYVGLNLSKTDQVDLKIRIISQRIENFFLQRIKILHLPWEALSILWSMNLF